MIPAGDLDRRLTLLTAVEVTDEANALSVTWTPGATVAAKKTDISDAERVKAQRVGAEITTRFLVRLSSVTAVITPLYRLRLKGRRHQADRDYEVVGVKDGEDDGLEITAKACNDGMEL